MKCRHQFLHHDAYNKKNWLMGTSGTEHDCVNSPCKSFASPKTDVECHPFITKLDIPICLIMWFLLPASHHVIWKDLAVHQAHRQGGSSGFTWSNRCFHQNFIELLMGSNYASLTLSYSWEGIIKHVLYKSFIVYNLYTISMGRIYVEVKKSIYPIIFS